MVLACLSSWGQAAIERSSGITAVVRDEVWRQMRFPALVRKLDADLRLQRAEGTIQIVATHRLSDFEAVGPCRQGPLPARPIMDAGAAFDP